MFRMTFPRALLISFLWHIFCFFAVVIVVYPVLPGKERLSKINFVGSVLDKDTFIYRDKNKNIGDIDKKHIIEKLTSESEDIFDLSKKITKAKSYVNRPYVNSIAEVINEGKDSPYYVAALTVGNIDDTYSPQIESELANRQIIYKPPTPAISKAFHIDKTPLKGEKFQIKLRFLVSPEGKVVFIEKLKSCGYPDIDLIAIRYTQKWQFAPLDKEKVKKNQEGIMLLELEAQ